MFDAAPYMPAEGYESYRHDDHRGTIRASNVLWGAPTKAQPMQILTDGPDDAPATILLAHGAGAPTDSASMTAITRALVQAGLRVARFEFGYMAARRSGQRKPPPRAELLQDEYRQAVEAVGASGPLIIDGKCRWPRRRPARPWLSLPSAGQANANVA